MSRAATIEKKDRHLVSSIGRAPDSGAVGLGSIPGRTNTQGI